MWCWGVHATTLTRLGIGNFHLADFDTFSIANFNRQAGAMTSTIDKSKVDVISAMVQDINPHANIQKFGAVTPENIDSFLEGVDIVVDGMDFFEIDVRRMIFTRAHEKGIPVITAAPLGFGSAVHIFDTHGMTFDEYFAITDAMPYKEKIVSFGIGITPSLLQSAYVDPASLKLDEKRQRHQLLGHLRVLTLWQRKCIRS